MGDERDPAWGLGESRGDDETRPDDLEHGGTLSDEVAKGNFGSPHRVGRRTRYVPLHQGAEVGGDKIILTRTQVNFIAGFIFGNYARIADIEITPEEIKHVEHLADVALGMLFPIREQNIEAEIDAFLDSL